MKNLFFLFILMLMLACTDQSAIERNTVLTSTIWEREQSVLFNGEMSDYHSPIRFLADGTYTLGEAGGSLNGNWKWINENEIQLDYLSITDGNQRIDLPETTQRLFIKKMTKTAFSYIIKGNDTFTGKDEEVNLIALN